MNRKSYGLYQVATFYVITFRVRRNRGEMYIGHGRLYVCLSLAAFPHYCTDPGVSWWNDRGCPLVVQHWAHFQSVHRFRCYDNICHRVVVLALCLFFTFYVFLHICGIAEARVFKFCTQVGITSNSLKMTNNSKIGVVKFMCDAFLANVNFRYAIARPSVVCL